MLHSTWNFSSKRYLGKHKNGLSLVSLWFALGKCICLKALPNQSCVSITKGSRMNKSFLILLQGNLKFSVDGETPVIENSKLVSVIADLLSTKTDLVEKALLFRTVATGRDIIEKQHTEQEATYGRNAFAKVNH